MDLSAGEEYEKRRRVAEAEYSQWQGQSGTYSIAALALAVVLVWSIIQLARGAGGFLLPAAALIGLAVCGVILARARTRSNRALRLLALYEKSLERVGGENSQTGHTGEEFAVEGHLYARDLHVVGPNSLFGMVATTRTAVGQAALAGWLLQGVAADEARRRQAVVQELTAAYDLREQIALLGRSAFEELPAERFQRWLNADAGGFPGWLRPVLLSLTSFWLLAIVAGLLLHMERDVLVRNVAALIAVQGALCLRFRAEVRAELELAERLAGQTAILRRGLQLLRGSGFASEALAALQASVAHENNIALGRLERLLEMVEQRAKEWYYAPALLLAVGTHAAVGLRRWKRAHAADMHLWLRAWGDFDAFLALSTYAAEHPENVYPTIVDATEDSAAVFTAEGLIHPLLAPASAIANDITLGADPRFLLISGSNMAGKSTLLRAMGANAVLGLAGLPIPARSCSMSALRIGASLAVTDNLAEQKSKFLAEVERLRAIVALAEENRGTTLFLIDEIFSGTNSQDRKATAGAVLRALMAAGASGALSTHDLTLTELADVQEWHGRNVHMASPDEEDPLGFDYKLKPGINQTTNAMAIVRMLGL